MFVGFDYGTSNCAMGVMQEGKANVLPLGAGLKFVPSTLHALEREMITDAVYRGMGDTSLKRDFQRDRQVQLQQAQRCRIHHGFDPDEETCTVGQDAIDAYLDYPEEGYFIKSPKSFLGATGLSQAQVAFFEDIVTLMMMSVKQKAEHHLNRELTQTVIGRPVNFQGTNEQQSNQQAIEILSCAASRAGFSDVDFLYEPLAAGMDYETTLHTDKTVLVVDVGGGTTDCSVVQMGPSYIQKTQRDQDFLGHSGLRVGGNDLDIHLSMRAFMPLFGLNTQMKSGLAMPSQMLWDAVAVNDVGAQKRFNSKAYTREIATLLLESAAPEKLKRLQQLQAQQQSYQVVRSGEQCKIALSEQSQCDVDLSYIESGLFQTVSLKEYADAIERPLSQIQALMTEAVAQAAVEPDCIYVTGGTAKSPIIHQAIQHVFPKKEIIVGDHFGSVTMGLAVWAERLFA